MTETVEQIETTQRPSLDDYRQVMAALDRADADLIDDQPPSMAAYRYLTVEHLTAIRDAVEDSLFHEHKRLGFASENPPAPAPVRERKKPVGRPKHSKLTEAEVREIHVSTDPGSVVADRYGISKTHVYRIRRGLVRVY
jgi:hypothetical protein